jgi:hypothetical protein
MSFYDIRDRVKRDQRIAPLAEEDRETLFAQHVAAVYVHAPRIQPHLPTYAVSYLVRAAC